MASAQELLADIVECSADGIGNASRYGSPIEHLLARAFIVLSKLRYPEVSLDDRQGITDMELLDEQLMEGSPYRLFVLIAPQVQIGKYRVDFVARYIYGLDGAAGLIVECDGHEFHEKTKEQAARDKARDRFFASCGYRVMRFTGSEIWANPIACAEQVIDATYHKAIDACNARACWRAGDIKGAERELMYMAREAL